MDFVNIIFIVLGAFVFLYALIESSIYASLYNDRSVMCPEKFIHKQKAIDVVAIVHSIYFMIFGLSCFVFGLSRFVKFNENIPLHVVFLSSVLCLVDMFLIWYMDKKHYLIKTMFDIKEQWKTEKKISDIHNHEVNVYRGVKRIKMYSKQAFFSSFVNLVITSILAF